MINLASNGFRRCIFWMIIDRDHLKRLGARVENENIIDITPWSLRKTRVIARWDVAAMSPFLYVVGLRTSWFGSCSLERVKSVLDSTIDICWPHPCVAAQVASESLIWVRKDTVDDSFQNKKMKNTWLFTERLEIEKLRIKKRKIWSPIVEYFFS